MPSVSDWLELNNQVHMPRLGLGVSQIPPGEPTERAVTWALEAGYRHIDTAKLYRNEASVGKAVRASTVPREEIFVTTKLFATDQLRVAKAFEDSLGRLGLDYVDLYLVHWPVPGLLRPTWRAMEAIYRSGRARAIGVSNYSVDQLERTLAAASTPPSVNQVRCSPFSFDRPLYGFCRSHDVCFEAHSPLTHGHRLADERLAALARSYGASPAQLLIAWALHKEMVVIPKSADKGRIEENARAVDLVISDEDLRLLDNLGAASD
jgi:diketogulonate reductase-like aldo/keto reductase